MDKTIQECFEESHICKHAFDGSLECYYDGWLNCPTPKIITCIRCGYSKATTMYPIFKAVGLNIENKSTQESGNDK